MKKVLLLIGFVLSAGLFSACSSDDEMSVEFKILNAEGVECYDFKEGDNIVFWLEIKNNTDEDAYLPPFSEIVGFNAFSVYSTDGKFMGMPWDKVSTHFRGLDFIGAHSSAIFVCPWFDVPSLAVAGNEHYYSNYFYKTEEKSPLPKGEYYSRFTILLQGKEIICNSNFNIK